MPLPRGRHTQAGLRSAFLAVLKPSMTTIQLTDPRQGRLELKESDIAGFAWS
jgi:hypothetical protein